MADKSLHVALYNHKGGVGKTTLTINIAAALCAIGKRVLLVDSDPQCNLTSYLIDDSVLDDLLDKSDTKTGATIWSAVKPVVEGEGNHKAIEPIEPGIAGLFLLPGDIRLADYERKLNDFWGESIQRQAHGYKGTAALRALVSDCATRNDIDYVFYDTGPNIGPLNRVILLGSDYFIVPVACDLFSLRAIKSLGVTLKDWILSWRTIIALAPANSPAKGLAGAPKFLGYIPQRFRTYGGTIARSALYYISRLEKGIHADLMVVLREVDASLVPSSLKSARLGDVKDFGSVVQMSQQLGVPLSAVSTASLSQRQEARTAFRKIADSIVKKTSGG